MGGKGAEPNLGAGPQQPALPESREVPGTSERGAARMRALGAHWRRAMWATSRQESRPRAGRERQGRGCCRRCPGALLDSGSPVTELSLACRRLLGLPAAEHTVEASNGELEKQGDNHPDAVRGRALPRGTGLPGLPRATQVSVSSVPDSGSLTPASGEALSEKLRMWHPCVFPTAL